MRAWEQGGVCCFYSPAVCPGERGERWSARQCLLSFTAQHLERSREFAPVWCKGKFGEGEMAEPWPLLCEDGVQATKISSGKAVIFWAACVAAKSVAFARKSSCEFYLIFQVCLGKPVLLLLAESVAAGGVLVSLFQRCLCFSGCAAWSAGHGVCADVLFAAVQLHLGYDGNRMCLLLVRI